MLPSDRMEELLKKASEKFDEHSSPFYNEWLSDNEVTFDECMSLSEHITWAIKVYLVYAKNAKSKSGVEQKLAALIASEVLRNEVTTEEQQEAQQKMKEEVMNDTEREKALDELTALNQEMRLYDFPYIPRLRFLRNEATKEGTSINEKSVKDFEQFVKFHPKLMTAGLCLMDSGNLRAIWKSKGHRHKNHFGVQFLGDGMVQYVIFKEREKGAGYSMERVAKTGTIEDLNSKIKFYDLHSLIYEKSV